VIDEKWRGMARDAGMKSGELRAKFTVIKFVEKIGQEGMDKNRIRGGNGNMEMETGATQIWAAMTYYRQSYV
jgi:hypothetical protein